MIDAPPSDAGAAHDSATWASPDLAIRSVGAPGSAVIDSEIWSAFKVAMTVGAPATLPPAITSGQPSIIAARNIPASVRRIPRPGRPALDGSHRTFSGAERAGASLIHVSCERRLAIFLTYAVAASALIRPAIAGWRRILSR